MNFRQESIRFLYGFMSGRMKVGWKSTLTTKMVLRNLQRVVRLAQPVFQQVDLSTTMGRVISLDSSRYRI